ncbi:MAG: hypothetical protein GY950_25705, partial [bacterium]|nr:hypothetical protein [bacterium]
MTVTPGGILFFRRFSFFVITVLAVFLFSHQNIYCQETGFKYFENYNPETYDRQPQNFWILQDKRDIIYVGNNGGVLEFDGVSWRAIEVPGNVVRSLAVDQNGTIYAGGKSEFGYLTPDSKGTLSYQSLLKKIEVGQKVFKDIWKVYVTDEGVYFQAKETLFRWNYKKIKAWTTTRTTRFHFSYACKGDFFIKQDKKGLMKMVNDELELVPGGEIFADKKIYMMVPYDFQNLLIGTRNNGLYIYDGIKAEPFQTDTDNYLKA